MKPSISRKYRPSEVPELKEVKNKYNETKKAFEKLEQGVYTALETYSNVHRGSGHYSMVSTHLYDEAREIVLEYLGLSKSKYAVIFCSPRRAEMLKAQLDSKNYKCISSQDIGLSLGVKAMIVKKKVLNKNISFQSGGGTARLVSSSWIIWTKIPEKFEAGTPAIINIIAFAKALRMIRQFGNDIFYKTSAEKLTASEILYRDELEKFYGRELLDELRKTLIGRNIVVPTAEGVRPFINLDNAASTPTFEPIWKTVCKTLRESREVQQEIISEVRSICAEALGAPLNVYDIIFTSNTTEAVNLAAESLSLKSENESETVVLNTLLEHNSNELPWRMTSGLSLIRLSTDREGFIDLKEMEKLLCEYNQKCQHGNKRIKLVAVSGASNVLGVFNDLSEISIIAHKYGAKLLVDAAQLVAHRKVEMGKYGIDYLAFSAHKAYAPFGSGALIARKSFLNFSLSELEQIKSSGEENAAGIAALGKALLLLKRIGMDLVMKEEQVLTGQALRGLSKIPGLEIYGIKDPDSSWINQKGGVIVFELKNLMANRVAKELAVKGGIGVRYGCHCSHILIKHLLNITPALERIQKLIVTLFSKISLPGLTRVSFGIENRKEDVDELIRVLGKIAGNSKMNSVGNSKRLKADVQKQMYDFIKSASQRIYK